MKSDRHVLDQVDALVHEALTPRDAEQVRKHVEVCPVCQVALKEAEKRAEALRALPALEAPQELVHKTLQRIDRYEQRTKRLRWWATKGFLSAAAAAALIIGALHLHFYNLTPLPYDLQVLGQTELLADSPASVRVRLVNRHTGQPLAGVPIDVELRGTPPLTKGGQRGSDADTPPLDKGGSESYALLASFNTDAQGTGDPRFHLPDWADGDYELRVTACTPSTWERIARTVRLKRSWKLMLTCDKPVYQPGQTIKLRGLALRRPDQKPVAGHDATFTVADPKGNVIFKQQDVTSKFGIVSAECPLATEINEGNYSLRCQVGDTQSERSVEVAKYVLPKFGIDVKLDRPYYEPGATVRGTVQADYFFGKPVPAGKVQVQCYAPDVGPQQIGSAEATTDATGKATFAIALPRALAGSERHAGDAQCSFACSVSDSAGQQQSRMLSCVVTNQPLRVEVMPESGTLVRGVANTIYLFASYADGRPAQARLAVSGIERAIETSALGVASFEITPESDEVGLTIRATDADGLIGRGHVQLSCGTAADDFLVRTDKAVYRGGETAQLVALGGGTESVFVDLIKDGQTMLTATVPMSAGRGEYALDLPAELSGTIRLVAYRFGNAGVAVRKSRVLFVQAADALRVEAAVDRQEYRPAGTAKLTISLTDENGTPTPGAVSLSAVDDAVYSVLGQRPGMEGTFFTLEQELLKPVYAIYPWTIDVDPAAPPEERERFEQALFTSTASPPPLQGGAGGRTPRARRSHANQTASQPAIAESHSLSATSYPAKVRRYQASRQSGLAGINTAWVILAVGGGVWLCAMLLFAYPKTTLVSGMVGFLVLAVLALSRISCAASPHAGGIESQKSIDKAEMAAPQSESGAETLKGEIRPAPDNPPRVRQWFPETLLWRPEVITDEHGKATLDVPLADSITTWRLACSAVSADGKLGGSESAIRVFQPFFVDLNLPVAMTRGDEVAVPVVVYNYLDKPQVVQLALEGAEWFERLDPPPPSPPTSGGVSQLIELKPGEARSTSYRLRVTKVGNWHLQVTARGDGVADAIRRAIEVVPDGRPVEFVYNGTLQQPADIALDVPENALDGSAKAVVKIYPSSFSQVVEGLDAIFQRPYGCFEQTSSTTYPNILALDYLRRTKKSVPEVEARARQHIHLGYQRLLSFETPGGGFDWFGNPPGKRTLTAYGLMEFEDMARVRNVDADLLARTRRWLLEQRNADGTWDPNEQLHDDPARGRDTATARLTTTAYIAWAVFGGGASVFGATRDYLLAHEPAAIDDPYVLALMANALQVGASSNAAQPYLDRLEAMKQSSEDGKLVWWDQPSDVQTTFYGAGRTGSIEATALAVLAMVETGAYPATTRAALAWLIAQKDAAGTWYSTQATVLALKALLAGTGQPLGGESQRRIGLAFDGTPLPDVVIPADQAEVMKQIEITNRLGAGSHELTLREPSGSAAGYSVAFRYHVPDSGNSPDEHAPLSIELAYDRTELPVNDRVAVTATVVNHLPSPAPMVLLDLPIPPGFTVDPAAFDAAVESRTIARYQLTARSAIVYLRALEPNQPLELRYRLRATMPVKVKVPPGRAYQYYDPDKKATSRPVQLVVSGGA